MFTQKVAFGLYLIPSPVQVDKNIAIIFANNNSFICFLMILEHARYISQFLLNYVVDIKQQSRPILIVIYKLVSWFRLYKSTCDDTHSEFCVELFYIPL